MIQWGVAHAALAGELKCGDSHLVKLFPGGALVAVLDGIGHGEPTGTAADAEAFREPRRRWKAAPPSPAPEWISPLASARSLGAKVTGVYVNAPYFPAVYGEGMAILSGDALLTEAFSLLAREPADRLPGDPPCSGKGHGIWHLWTVWLCNNLALVLVGIRALIGPRPYRRL